MKPREKPQPPIRNDRTQFCPDLGTIHWDSLVFRAELLVACRRFPCSQCPNGESYAASPTHAVTINHHSPRITPNSSLAVRREPQAGPKMWVNRCAAPSAGRV